jgi:2-oxoglutarate ferredoxin oxidoreductase subunit gamma
VHEEIIIGGFGGQGVLFIGRLLAEAAFQEGHEVVYMPSYGAEKRGGNAWCHVTISDEEIGALFITRPTTAIAMNPTSLAKLEPVMRPEGLVVVNQSLVPSKVSREDVHPVYVPANELAAELGDSSVSNLVALGALLASRPVVSMPGLIAVLDNMLSKNKERLEMNRRALDEGYRRAQPDHVCHPSGRRRGDNHVR